VNVSSGTGSSGVVPDEIQRVLKWLCVCVNGQFPCELDSHGVSESQHKTSEVTSLRSLVIDKKDEVSG